MDEEASLLDIPAESKEEFLKYLKIFVEEDKYLFSDTLPASLSQEEHDLLRLKYRTVFVNLMKKVSRQSNDYSPSKDESEKDLLAYSATNYKKAEDSYGEGLLGVASWTALHEQGTVDLIAPLTWVVTSQNQFLCFQLDERYKLKSKPSTQQELFGFLRKNKHKQEYPGYILKINRSANVEVFPFSEYKALVKRIKQLQEMNYSFVIQEYVKSKSGLPNKIRVNFSSQVNEALVIKKASFGQTPEEAEIKNFLSYDIFNNREVPVGKNMIVHRIFNKNTLSNDTTTKLEVIRVVLGLADFVIKAIEFHSKHNAKHQALKEFLVNKVKKYSTIKRNLNLANENIEKNTQIWFSSYKKNEIFKIKSQDQLNTLKRYMQVLCKALSSNIMDRSVIEVTADFIENENRSFVFIGTKKIATTYKKTVFFPKHKPMKHILLHAEYTPSIVQKNKLNEIICCGDYCYLFKRDNIELTEKLEYLLKTESENIETFYELLKLQKSLNTTNFQCRFSKSSHKSEQISRNTQCRVLRRSILFDKTNKDSIMNKIKSLPKPILHSLKLKIKSENTSPSYFNKQMAWEFERVPVCDLCYSVYNRYKKIPNRQTAEPEVKRRLRTQIPLNRTQVISRSMKSISKYTASVKSRSNIRRSYNYL